MAPDPDQIRRDFRSRIGCDPAGVWSAPGRVNLIGEHTDYNQGFVLPIAIGARTYVAASPRADGILRGWSAHEPEGFEVRFDGLEPGGVPGWAAYACGPAWVLGQMGRSAGGADLLIDSAIPAGAGLSSSAALVTAVALALSDLGGEVLSGTILAEVAHRAESQFVGVPVGTMDQMISALGRRGNALFLDTRDGNFQYVPFEPDRAGLSLMVINTRVVHDTRQGGYAKRRGTCEAAASALGLTSLREATLEMVDSLSGVEAIRARHVVTENERVLEVAGFLCHGDFEQVGSAFVESHRSLRDMYEVSCPELNLAVEAALRAGALGARMTGAGFGGSAIALIEKSRVRDLRESVTGAIRGGGFLEPQIFEVRAEDGAARNR